MLLLCEYYVSIAWLRYTECVRIVWSLYEWCASSWCLLCYYYVIIVWLLCEYRVCITSLFGDWRAISV